MFLKNLRLIGASCVLPLLFVAASPASAAGANPIVIGQSIDLSGPNGTIGRDYVAGIKTCFDMVNASGGINGRKLQFVVHDDRGQPDAAASATAELLEREQADYLIGGVGDASTQAVIDSAAFKRSGQLLFAPLAAADYPNSARVLIWRPSYKQEIRHIFSHFSKLGINDVGVVYQETPFNAAAYRSLAAELRERNIRLAVTAKIGANGEQSRTEAARIAAARPGFVLVLADTIGTALFLKEYRKLDGQTFVAGSSLTNLSMLRELAGARAVEWTVFSQVVPNPGGGTSPIQVEHMNMMRKYRDEAVSSLTLEGFAVAKALVKAIQQSKHERAALQEFLARDGDIDLGGLSMVAAGGGKRLSNYLDIALFRKGSALMF